MSIGLVSGDQILLRNFSHSDVSSTYVSWLNDASLMKYSNQRFLQHNRRSCIKYLSTMRLNESPFLAICLKEDKKVIGTLSAHLDHNHATANLALLIGATEARGKGFGTLAWNLGLEYLFDFLRIRKVHAGTLAENAAMNAIARSSGMRLEGVLFEQELLEGRPANMNVYGKLRG